MTKNTKSKGLTSLAALLTSPAAKERLENFSTTCNDGTRFFLSQMPNLRTIGKDGVDHINVSVENTNALGNIFSKMEPSTYTDRVLGLEVCSIGGWFNFLAVGGTNLKLLTDTNARRTLREGTVPKYQRLIDETPILIAWGLWQKINCNEDIRVILRDLSVPIDAYITRNGRQLRTRDMAVHALALTEIRKALREHRHPSLYKFMVQDAYKQIAALPAKARMDATIEYVRDLLAGVNADLSAASEGSQTADADVQAQAEEGSKKRRRRRNKVKRPVEHNVAIAEQATTEEAPAAPVMTSEQLDAAILAGQAGDVVVAGQQTPEKVELVVREGAVTTDPEPPAAQVMQTAVQAVTA